MRPPVRFLGAQRARFLRAANVSASSERALRRAGRRRAAALRARCEDAALLPAGRSGARTPQPLRPCAPASAGCRPEAPRGARAARSAQRTEPGGLPKRLREWRSRPRGTGPVPRSPPRGVCLSPRRPAGTPLSATCLMTDDERPFSCFLAFGYPLLRSSCSNLIPPSSPRPPNASLTFVAGSFFHTFPYYFSA